MNTVLLCILSIAIIVPYASSRSAYCTYHMYNAGDSLGTVACSDGANGIMTNFGYSNISPMFPYVTAYSGASWNSPQCGKCVRVQGSAGTAYLTVIDYCGPPPGGYDAHFDIAPPAFRQIFGDAGVNAGVQRGEWDFVESWRCQGNKGNSGGNPPPSNPPPSNPPPSNPPPSNGGKSTQRCGANWGAADSSCGRDCNNNNDCGGQLCFKDLKPCGGSNPPSNPPPSNPPPPPSNQQKVTTRCGRDWSDANSKCGTPCSNDAVCGGEHCFADLKACTFGAAGEESLSADNFVIEESFNNDNADNFAVDAAVADVAEEEYVDNYVDMAMADANFGADSNFDADAAVAGELSSLNTQQQQQTQGEAGMQGWMVGILVMFSITTVLLLAVIVLGVFVMRKH